jgi:hypothetical protein
VGAHLMATVPYPQSDKAVDRDVTPMLRTCERRQPNGTFQHFFENSSPAPNSERFQARKDNPCNGVELPRVEHE